MDSEKTLKTIEKLMTENSRLQLEVQQAIKGKFPDSYLAPDHGAISLELLRNAGLGRYFRDDRGRDPNLYELISEASETLTAYNMDLEDKNQQIKQLYKREEDILKALQGGEIEGIRNATVRQASRTRAILELIKIRLARLEKTNDDLARLYVEVKDFLGEE